MLRSVPARTAKLPETPDELPRHYRRAQFRLGLAYFDSMRLAPTVTVISRRLLRRPRVRVPQSARHVHDDEDLRSNDIMLLTDATGSCAGYDIDKDSQSTKTNK